MKYYNNKYEGCQIGEDWMSEIIFTQKSKNSMENIKRICDKFSWNFITRETNYFFKIIVDLCKRQFLIIDSSMPKYADGN